jgi:hypothetical protein
MMDRCCTCKRNGELVNHLLLHCDVASAIWSVFLVILGCPGLCLEVLLIYLTVGGPMVGLGVRYGEWCLRASFGVYGRK